MSDTYQCAVCQGVFEKLGTEEEAEAEAFKNFGIKDASTDPNMLIVCDDCYQYLVVPLIMPVSPNVH